MNRLLARLVSGPLARFVAFVADFTAMLWRAARGHPEHPEERPRAPRGRG